MRAVNLIPPDAARSGRTPRALTGPSYILVAILAIAVVFVTLYVLAGNSITQQRSKLASLRGQVAQEQAAAARLSSYTQFEKLAQTRAQTVREIASSRFDWHAALSDLSKVVPSNTSLQSLLGTVAPGASVNGAGGNAGQATETLRAGISAPAFELKGCTSSQYDVARLMSRLRLINEVTRVSLADSQKPDATGSSAGGASASTATSAGPSGASGGCGPEHPSFDLVVFFKALPGAGPNGLISGGSQQVTGAAPPASQGGAASAASSSQSVSTPASGGSR